MHLSQITKQPQSTFQAILLLFILLFLLEISFKLYQRINGMFFSLDLPFEISGLLSAISLFMAVNVPLVFAEKFSPGTKNERRYLQGATYWLIYIIFSYYWSILAAKLSLKLQPLFIWNIQEKLDDPINIMTVVVGLLLPLLLFDFFYYWFHRAQHNFSFLWRFHKVHHSINNLNCISSYHHFTEEVFRFPVIAIPVAFLTKITAPQLVILSAFISAWGQFIHSDTSINLGKFNLVFSDNAYHRIHHSVEERHFDKNFAAFFPVWDILFGTFCKPEKARLPVVGLLDTLPPKSMIEYAIMPFQKHAQSFLWARKDSQIE